MCVNERRTKYVEAMKKYKPMIKELKAMRKQVAERRMRYPPSLPLSPESRNETMKSSDMRNRSRIPMMRILIKLITRT